MSTVQRGSLARLVRQLGGTIVYNRDGSVSCFETYVCLYSQALALAPKRNVSKHPVFSDLYCKEVEIVEIAGERAEIRASYIGAPQGGDLSQGGVDPTPEYSLNTETNEEPIETHPKFVSDIGTTGNLAKFDTSTGLFLGFAKPSAFTGVTSYLAPGQIWKKQGVASSPPSAAESAKVGYIDAPDGDVATPQGRNWLLRSFTWEQQGKVYPYVKIWQLSGPGGWNTTIYTKPD